MGNSGTSRTVEPGGAAVVVPETPLEESGLVVNSDEGDKPRIKCDSSDVLFKLVLLLDAFGTDTSWERIDINTGELLMGPSESSSYLNFAPYPHSCDACLASGQYMFYISDEGGDGICCRHGEGMYSIAVNGLELKKNDGQFREVKHTRFVVNNGDERAVIIQLPHTHANPDPNAGGSCRDLEQVCQDRGPLSNSNCLWIIWVGDIVEACRYGTGDSILIGPSEILPVLGQCP